jgi:hypothetical protein
MATLISQRALGRGIVAALLVAIIIFVIFLIVLGSMVGFVVDWLWFSAIGYLNVFWTIIIAKAEVFLAVFVATAGILWLNGALALRFARTPWMARRAIRRRPVGMGSIIIPLLGGGASGAVSMLSVRRLSPQLLPGLSQVTLVATGKLDQRRHSSIMNRQLRCRGAFASPY